MATIYDVAAYILRTYGTMTTMKLQKLAFYSQAQSLSVRKRPLFDADFQAWRGGPVSPELFEKHEGKFLIRDGELDPQLIDMSALTGEEKSLIETVCRTLSDLSGKELSERTHQEAPWKDARKGLAAEDACNTVISKEAIGSYYRSHPVV